MLLETFPIQIELRVTIKSISSSGISWKTSKHTHTHTKYLTNLKRIVGRVETAEKKTDKRFPDEKDFFFFKATIYLRRVRRHPVEFD